jgi:hypothetical protein
MFCVTNYLNGFSAEKGVVSIWGMKFFESKTPASVQQEIPKLAEREEEQQRNELAVIRDAVTKFGYYISIETHAMGHRAYARNNLQALADQLREGQRALLNARMYGQKVKTLAQRVEKDYTRVRDFKKDDKVQYLVDDERQILTRAKSLNNHLSHLATTAAELANEIENLLAKSQAPLDIEDKKVKKILENIKELHLDTADVEKSMKALYNLERTADQLMNEYLNTYGKPTEQELATQLK